MLAPQDRIKASAMTQVQASQMFGMSQPRISDLMRGQIDLFWRDTLVAMSKSTSLRLHEGVFSLILWSLVQPTIHP
jgi:predicted XRE-type DNA-binding protein